MHSTSENSKKDMKRRVALGDVAQALEELTANLIRVTRGAGKSHEIRRHALALVKAFDEHWEVAGCDPEPAGLNDMLSIEVDDNFLDQAGNEAFDRINAQENIIDGCLQIAAARLLGQKLQEAAGRERMSMGLSELTKIRSRDK